MKNNILQHKINHIKTWFIRNVVGQYKRNRQCTTTEYGQIQLRWTDEVEHRKRYEQTMTYIVAGKFNNNPFLMVDCVGTIPTGEHMFCNKLIKLKSTKSEVYSTITGYDTFQVAINLFDSKCYENEIIFDIENKQHINEILEIYGYLKNNIKYDIEKNFLHSGLFFIMKDKIVWYKITRDENDELEISMSSHIINNQILEDFYTIQINNNQFNNPNEIIDYCKKAIIKHYKQKKETKDLDLKDKFSFIMFNGSEKIKILSYQNNEEMVLSIIGCNYDKI